MHARPNLPNQVFTRKRAWLLIEQRVQRALLANHVYFCYTLPSPAAAKRQPPARNFVRLITYCRGHHAPPRLSGLGNFYSSFSSPLFVLLSRFFLSCSPHLLQVQKIFLLEGWFQKFWRFCSFFKNAVWVMLTFWSAGFAGFFDM